MRVIRSMSPDGWVPIANVTAQNHKLSWRAKGLLLELLSYPDGYDLTFEKLMERARSAGGKAEGRDAMRKAMQELEQAGLLTHVRHRIDGSVGDRKQWRTETVVTDLPGVADVRATGLQDPGGSVTRSSSKSANQEVSNNTGSLKTDHQDDEGQHSSALAAARAGQLARGREGRRRELDRLYSAADKLNDDQVRRLLLQFERKRPRIYREQRQAALAQLGREKPDDLRSVRAVDMLSFKYALQHYGGDGKPLPDWLVRFPR
ncbi:hypothetical protein GCM10011583_18310 [Streptomyces camponoticapitis]|uniref:Uncharacterized protein n=1 Tax=Streptomyces camponoticapitis TaxID=1616125 RepID=A0ABQ2E1T0_9ACTN|nr:hypothetical protein [Streptomyces camponoticapitis]GGJ87037.1 hypothetical protein GCM10011583_18310 [Streptomyces camponoticapitis]